MQPFGVAIIGVGSIGKALAFSLTKREDVTLRLWDKDPLRVPRQASLENTVSGADAVFLCVPSWIAAFALRDIAPFLSPDTVVVTLTKGVEPEQARFVPEVLDATLPAGQPWVLLGGPMLAAEIVEGQPSVGVAASPRRDAAQKIAALFAGTGISIEASEDVIGVALLGVLKNVFAIGLGIAEALEWEGNACGWYVSQALRECAAVVGRAGGSVDTVLGSAGAGDLVATGFSRHSRNRTYGRALVKGGICPTDSEGCASLPHLLKRLGPSAEAHLLLKSLAAIIIEKKDARAVFGALLT